MNHFQPVGVDHAFHANQRVEAFEIVRRLLIEAHVVEEQPDGENRVQIRLVGIDFPVAAAQIHALHHHHQDLFAGGHRKRPHDPFVMVEVVDVLFEVHEGLALGDAVEIDPTVVGFADRGGAERKAGLHDHGHVGHLQAGEVVAALRLLDGVAVGKILEHGGGLTGARSPICEGVIQNSSLSVVRSKCSRLDARRPPCGRQLSGPRQAMDPNHIRIVACFSIHSRIRPGGRSYWLKTTPGP